MSRFERKVLRNYFNKLANKNIITNRNFWKIIGLSLTNKGHLENTEVLLIQDKKNEHELVKVFNKHYINIIEKSGGQKPTNKAKSHTTDNDKQAVELICNHSVHRGIDHPLKNTTPLFVAKPHPPLNLQTVQVPPF